MQELRWMVDETSMTKRRLGWLLIVIGTGLAVGAVLLELLQTGQGGFGAVQRIAAVGGGLSALVGLTLLPLGDRLA